MNAEEARKLTRQSIAKARRQELAEREKREAARQEQVAFERAKIPQFLTKLKAAIKASAAAGGSSATISVGDLEYEVKNELKEKVSAMGYTARIESGIRDVDYGDFNAPCVTQESYGYLTVSW